MISTAGEPPVAWRTGRALDDVLRQPLGLSWTAAPVASAVAKISQTQRIAIVLDRRIDPGQTLTLDVSGQRLADVLGRIAQHVGAGYCQFGPVAYIGPKQVAEKLRTLAALRTDDVEALASGRAPRLLRLATWQWDDLAEPRKLVDELADQAGVNLTGAESIPHDLWRAAEWPSMSWIDRLTLVLAQFDLTFELSAAGRRVTLVPIPERVAIARNYRAGRRAGQLAQRWSRELPETRITAGNGNVRVEGLIEDHEFVESRLRGRPTKRTKTTVGREVYQFAAENAALDRVVEQVAARLQLDVQWDRQASEQAGIAVDQLITVRVKDASLDELLRAIFKDTHLAYRLKGRTLTIAPSKP